MGVYQPIMRKPGFYSVVTVLVFTLAACSQRNAPSEAISDAADSVVKTVDGTAAPRLAKGRLAPRDDCAAIEGADDFRAQLAQAVGARDAERLTALAAPDIKLDFGGGSGAGELRKRLAADGTLWSELAELVQLGCAAGQNGGIVIPWVFEQDLGVRDPAMTMIVTGEDVPVYPAVDGPATPLSTISWDAVELANGLVPGAQRQAIKLSDGKTAFIATDQLRSVLEYRLFASSRDGKWSITSLVRGD
jgi:hypothetical protein